MEKECVTYKNKNSWKYFHNLCQKHALFSLCETIFLWLHCETQLEHVPERYAHQIIDHFSIQLEFIQITSGLSKPEVDYDDPWSISPISDPFCPKPQFKQLSNKCRPKTLWPTDAHRQINSDYFKSTYGI